MTENRIMGRRYDGKESPLGKPAGLIKDQTLAVAIVHGFDDDAIVTPGGALSSVKEMRQCIKIIGYTPEEFALLSKDKQDKIHRKLERMIVRGRQNGQLFTHGQAEVIWGEDERRRRADLFASIVQWSKGDIKLERPQGTSLHHLLEYDNAYNGGYTKTLIHENDTQSFVVENDWGRVVPSDIAGEWRLPFEHICWEFRISGVRVLAFTDAKDVENPRMIIVYGKDRLWVSDDYVYHLYQRSWDKEALSLKRSMTPPTYMEKVVTIVFANIRASCIMLDARIAHAEASTPSDSLVRRAVKDGRKPPRKHHVVRLLRERRTNNGQRTGTGHSGYRQGGHWRPGRWLHYDNPDSGQVQYPNDGGFIVSKSWQHWHFAGDPNNIIEKEYRL